VDLNPRENVAAILQVVVRALGDGLLEHREERPVPGRVARFEGAAHRTITPKTEQFLNSQYE
jgi:hypothetical protein